MAYSQTDRTLEIQTTLGTDLAMLTQLEGEERISQPFLFNIRFVSEEPPHDVARLLGTAVSIKCGWPEATGGLERRPLHGHIRRLRRGMASRGLEYEWHAEIVPALWFLSRTSDCRIFQDKSIPDIIVEVLRLHEITAFRNTLLGTYEPREYVVQYRESALDFIQRLMEEAGIFYWHVHTDSEHQLVLADDNVSAPANSEPYGFLGTDARNSVMSLDEEIVVRSGKWTLRDFNFKTPSATLEVMQPTTIDVAEMRKRERYDYPGIYEQSGPGRDVARRRIENEETFHRIFRGESGISDFVAGAHVKINDVTEPELLLTEVRHQAEDYSHWTDESWAANERKRGLPGSAGGARDPFYSNEFVCIPIGVTFRPERVTPRPFVQGPQTAIVTGPSGEEIHTDEFGRVKVQFHWDRLGQKDAHTSCWIRVSQGWAGKSWGQMHIPRIGHEVIVDFLEGDPDRPIITGRVYNAENTVPYALPANKTQSGIKSNSSKGGGGSNEFRFEDNKGSEQVYFHAEKDLDSLIENNETRNVGGKGTGDRTTLIKNDETITVGGNRTETVAKNETISIGQNRAEVVGLNESVTIGVARSHVVGASDSLAVGAARSVAVGAADSTAVGASQSLQVARDQSVVVGKNQSVSVEENQTVTVGKDGLIKIGKKFMIDAGDQIVLKTGSAQIIMKKNGDINIKGKNISIEGSGKINAKASGNIIMKGQKISQN